MSRYDDVLARLLDAAGPDRELDFEIFLATTKLDCTGEFLRMVFGQAPDSLEDFTASIDAALALVEKMLPGWTWSLSSGRIFEMGLFNGDGDAEWKEFFGEARTAPLAILTALFEALKAQEADHD